MFNFIKKLFKKEQPTCEYSHVIYVLNEIQKAGAKKRKAEEKKTKVKEPKKATKVTKKKGK